MMSTWQNAFVTSLIMMTSPLLRSVMSAPCCGNKTWAAEVRVVSMDTQDSNMAGKEDYYWISFDVDRQQVAAIIFDPRPGHGDAYRRSLLDYKKGQRCTTSDEVHCTCGPLTGSGPLERLCVPPAGGNITLDVRKFFGVYPDPLSPVRRNSPLSRGKPSHFSHFPNISDRRHRRGGQSLHEDDSMGMYAETIYYETDDVVGYATVTSLTCDFVNEMTYSTLEGGRLVWQHTQWNNLTTTVDPQNFDMPKSCHINTTHPPVLTTDARHSPIGQMAEILRQL